MPRARLPQLHSITDGSFEPSRKNPIMLGDDSNLDTDLKSISIGGKSTALSLSDSIIKLDGKVELEQIETSCKFIGDIYSLGDIKMEAGRKLWFDADLSPDLAAGMIDGNTYIYADDDVLYFYVGGEKLLTIGQTAALGQDDKITTFTSDLSIDEGQKLYFEGMSSDSYLHRTTGDIYELYGDNTKLFSVQDDGIVTLHEGHLAFQNGEFIKNEDDGKFEFCDGAGTVRFMISSNRVAVPAGNNLYLDGGSNTYIEESAADTLDFIVGGATSFRIYESGDVGHIGVWSGSKIFLDVANGHTYIQESSDDVLDIVVGTDTIFQITESGADGNTIDIDNACIGFTQIEPTYDATTTEVDFRHSNKQFVTFGSGNITNLTLFFPLVSGNFVCLIKQDGTGSRTITNYKAMEFDESAADGQIAVKFAGGSNPTLTTDANHVDILSFYWDADNEIAYGVATLDFQF